MPYAEVCVNSPGGRQQLFSYAVPARLSVRPGQAVWAPFGSRTLQGIVISLSELPQVENVRELAGLMADEPVLSPLQVELACWLSQYYLAPLWNAVACLLPPGFARGGTTYLAASQTETPADLPAVAAQALALIRAAGRLDRRELDKALGPRRAQRALSCLDERDLVAKAYEIAPPQIQPKTETLVYAADGAAGAVAELQSRRAHRQAELLRYLCRQAPPVRMARVTEAGFDRALVNVLVRRGLLSLEEAEVRRDPIGRHPVRPSVPLLPTPAQQQALAAIRASLGQSRGQVFLLHGVTGSGKTEVYLQALAEAVHRHRQGIVLVPEIALTPQTIERFEGRFPRRVAVLHSQLTLRERYDQWRDIRAGAYDVVVGVRSAVFAPLPRLGLIVLDEEHEWSYKQDEPAPRYHAREVARKLAELAGATVVLGSATPDVESYYRAAQGAYRLLTLPARITPQAALPRVEVVDLRAELKAGNRSIFSADLQAALQQTLARREQAILFVNRRGTASAVQCRACGATLRCRACQVALSYHADAGRLVCHQCNARTPVPQTCPACGSRRIRFLGLGTQRLLEETAAAFPAARLLRWDSDSAQGRRAHEDIMLKLRSHAVDVLIGTQMVAKGLDLPLVTLVGVVSADTTLNLPDFRAGERTFQLLMQVAGRAGRGEVPGRVIVQTYAPGHYAIAGAGRQDYRAFYDEEIALRRELGNPPFSQLICLTVGHKNEAECAREAARLHRELREGLAGRGLADIRLVGPAPAYPPRLRGRYRWQLLLKGISPARVLAGLTLPLGWTVDVDPLGLG